MNSSTSSFRTEFKVVAFVVLALVGIELVMRGVAAHLSIDVAHIRSGGEISDRLGSSPEQSLLLLGNSLTRAGVAPELLVSGAGGALSVEAYHPDGSSVNEWSYAYRRFFDRPGMSPDFLIIGAGRSHLFDGDLPPENFGAYYCANRDIRRYFERHVHDPDDAARFLLARFSVAYTNRRRVQPRLFTALIPHYQEVLRILQSKPRVITAEVERELGHRNLAELLKEAGEAGTRVAVVAIPMPERYPLPESTVRVIRDGGAILIDARGLDGIQSEHFPDGYHLDPDGARILTEYLIKQIQPHWWPDSTHGD